jgi:hypothetical protein
MHEVMEHPGEVAGVEVVTLHSPDANKQLIELVKQITTEEGDIDTAIDLVRRALEYQPELMEELREHLILVALREYVHRYRGMKTVEIKHSASKPIQNPSRGAESAAFASVVAMQSILEMNVGNRVLGDISFKELPAMIEDSRQRALGFNRRARLFELILPLGEGEELVGEKLTAKKANGIWKKVLAEG